MRVGDLIEALGPLDADCEVVASVYGGECVAGDIEVGITKVLKVGGERRVVLGTDF